MQMHALERDSAMTTASVDPLIAFVGGIVAGVALVAVGELQAAWRVPSDPAPMARGASDDPMVARLRSDGVVVGSCPAKGGYITYELDGNLWINAKTTAGIVAMRVKDIATACAL